MSGRGRSGAAIGAEPSVGTGSPGPADRRQHAAARLRPRARRRKPSRAGFLHYLVQNALFLTGYAVALRGAREAACRHPSRICSPSSRPRYPGQRSTARYRVPVPGLPDPDFRAATPSPVTMPTPAICAPAPGPGERPLGAILPASRATLRPAVITPRPVTLRLATPTPDGSRSTRPGTSTNSWRDTRRYCCRRPGRPNEARTRGRL